MMKEVAKYKGCFVCGPDNPIGLKLQFFADGDTARTTYRPSPLHEGYEGIAHGGIIAAILDEVMIKAALARDIHCVTAQMEVKFKAPALIDSELVFEGRITEIKGRIISTSGQVSDTSGRLIAEASAKYMTVPQGFEAKLKESLEP
jgi:uncharacterized protein (TIGR00369 family)